MKASSDAPPPSGRHAAVRRYVTATAFEAALKARLAAAATAQTTVQDLRKKLAFDRVLARLSQVAPDAWLLKGGVALEYRLPRARATTDIDISARCDVETMAEAIRAAVALDLNDYFALRLGDRSKPIPDVETYRFKISVLYENGRPFEQLKIDVGFADAWIGTPRDVTAPALLDFAGIEPATVRAIPVELHLAEKIHAYSRRYGGRESTRVKDLVDMALLVGSGEVDDNLLAQALTAVFDGRGTHPVPSTLAPPPRHWAMSYARLADDLPIPRHSTEAHRLIAKAVAVPLTRAASCA